MNPPESFEFTKPQLWPEWKQRFERYRIATKLNKEDNEIQISTLMYSMGKQAEHIYNSFTGVKEGKDDYETILEQFDAYFVPKRNIIHERARFYQRRQNAGESVEAFIRSLYELAENCEFSHTRDEQIRDRLVIGLQDKHVSQSLQMKAGLDLQSAIEMARQAELVKKQNMERDLMRQNRSMRCDGKITDEGIGIKDSHSQLNNNNNNSCVVGAIESMLKNRNVLQEVRNVEIVLKWGILLSYVELKLCKRKLLVNFYENRTNLSNNGMKLSFWAQ